MHGSTKKMVDYLVSSLVIKGVTVQQFDMSVADTGKLAMALVDAGTIVIGTPTVMIGPHPMMAYAAVLANALNPRQNLPRLSALTAGAPKQWILSPA